MARRDPHPADPRRSGSQTGGHSAYRAGYRAGRRDKAGPGKLRAANTGGIPPRKTGCPIKLLMLLALPIFLIRHLIGDRR